MAIFRIINASEPSDPDSYTLAVVPPTCISPKDHICYIIALNNGANKPVIDTPLLIEIITTLSNNADSLNVKLKP